MATNIEIKAVIKDFVQLRNAVEALSDTPCKIIPQEDTFFHVPDGRLKLRVLSSHRGELIYYERQDAAGPRRSNYLISTTGDPDALKTVLAAALGIRGVVRKQRLLYMVGNTRIHLDQVEGLGPYLELEVMLGPSQTEADGKAIADELMAKLGIAKTDLVKVAYIDLLEQQTTKAPAGDS